MESMWYLSISTLKKHVAPLGNTELRRFRVRVETSLSGFYDYEFGELPRVAFYLSAYSFIRSWMKNRMDM